MKQQEQYKELLIIKPQIDEKLINLDFKKIKELILWMTKSEIYQKLKEKDDQLRKLEQASRIWLKEKKILTSREVDDDFFKGIYSLESLEKKYLTILYCVLRMETPMPEEYYEQALEKIMDLGVSGIALAQIIFSETVECEQNILKIAQLLKQHHQYIVAVELLQFACEQKPKNSDIILELADCWLEGQQWQQAYDCLKKIRKPDESVKALMEELEKVIGS